ncbi:sulfite exporter TauE/SafE family protein [Acidiferrobacter sp.]|uniref:sulfite exporter TauE/SafE family protein n=1 Tax=Acidiferrobacter sp. TaxID=1872107 RepID=UPI0026303EB0|nr:sulfite exporter TauE/SafE family protein [Acidiferrobacter sp.]
MTHLTIAELLHRPMLLALLLLIVFAAFYVRATIGFGSGLIAVALLSLYFPVKEVVPVVLLLDLLGSVLLGAYDFREMQWQELTWLIPGSLVGLAIGAVILAHTHAQRLTLFLGIFILAYVVYAIAAKPERVARIARAWALPLGVFGGIIGSLYGGGGPPLVAYLQMRHLEKRAFRATFQAIALADNVVRGGLYAAFGLLTWPLTAVFAVMAPAAAFGLYLGNHLHMRINQRLFLRATLALLAVVGAKYLI